MRGLTRREILLMYIATVLLVIYGGGFLLCMPAREELHQAKQTWEELYRKQESVKAELGRLSMLEEEVEHDMAVFLESRERYRGVREVTTLEQSVLEHLDFLGLTPISTDIQTREEREVAEETPLVFQVGSIEMKAFGRKSACIRLVEELNQNSAWKLVSYSVYPEDGAWTVEVTLEYEMPQAAEELLERLEASR